MRQTAHVCSHPGNRKHALDLKQAGRVQLLRAIRKESTALRTGFDTHVFKRFTSTTRVKGLDCERACACVRARTCVTPGWQVTPGANGGLIRLRGSSVRLKDLPLRPAEAVADLSVSCHIAVTHTHSHTPSDRYAPGLLLLLLLRPPPGPNFQAYTHRNAHVLIADGHVRSQVEPLKMWPGAKGHPLMSKSFFTPFVGGEGAKEMRSLGGTEVRGGVGGDV